MRQGTNTRRSRGRGPGTGSGGGGGGGNNASHNRRPNNVPLRHQTFDSNGPDVRIRGNAHQVHEKYLAMARDATSAGDRIAAENYYQHAEHYFRIISAINEAENQRRNIRETGGGGSGQPHGDPQGNGSGNGNNGQGYGNGPGPGNGHNNGNGHAHPQAQGLDMLDGGEENAFESEEEERALSA